jgi:AmmeMemoRadiSam system protein A
MIDDGIFLKIVKDSIKEEIYNINLIDKDLYISLYPELKELGATFITINKSSSLRGCIGSLVAHRALIDDLVLNAKSAAFKDPRFSPLSVEEFEDPNLSIEISLLNQPKELRYDSIVDLKSKIRPKTDGVILSKDNYRATFLPQVWEQLPTFELFFEHLCHKAGISGNCLEDHPKIELYQVRKIR